MASGKAGELTAVELAEETLMAGLSCGEPSQLAWDVLSASVRHYMTIPDSLVAPAVRLLANPQSGDQPVEAGESAVAGLIGLICAARQPTLRALLGLTKDSRAVIIGSEGVTDPDIYRQIMAEEI